MKRSFLLAVLAVILTACTTPTSPPIRGSAVYQLTAAASGITDQPAKTPKKIEPVYQTVGTVVVKVVSIDEDQHIAKVVDRLDQVGEAIILSGSDLAPGQLIEIGIRIGVKEAVGPFSVPDYTAKPVFQKIVEPGTELGVLPTSKADFRELFLKIP